MYYPNCSGVSKSFLELHGLCPFTQIFSRTHCVYFMDCAAITADDEKYLQVVIPDTVIKHSIA